MIYFLIYIAIGLFWSYCLVLDDDRRAIFHPGYTLFIVVTWPILMWWLFGRMTRITRKGKVVWERKK